jgi:uncharacterized membrane protein YdjX (TVP38/TMEM64 family)
MAKNLLLTTLYEKRIEIKYVTITLVLAGSLFLLASGNVFDGLEHHVNTIMSDLAEYGAVGMFLIAMVLNMTLVINAPYNLPMFALILCTHTFWGVILIGTATALGAGIGEVLSYAAARAILASVDDMENSTLYRWTKKQIGRRPSLIPYLVWLTASVPVPDHIILLPAAMVNYPWRKMIVPIVTGKLVQNNVLALIFYYAADSASGPVSSDFNIELAAFTTVLFVVIIAYQIEKSRLDKKEAAVAAHDNPSAHYAMLDQGGPEALCSLEVVPVFEKATDLLLEI